MEKYFFYFCFLFSTLSFAQDKSFDIVIGSGKYWTPARKRISGGGFFNAEFEYHYKKRWSFSAGVIISKYSFESKDSLSSIYLGITDQVYGEEFQTNFLVKYKIYDSKRFTFQIGTGLGLIIMGRSTYINLPQGGIHTYFHSNSDLAFPLSAELYTKITKNILIGVKFGSCIYPDYPIVLNNMKLEVVGNNIGLQARFRL